MQQLHNHSSRKSYDDLIGARTDSASRRAEMLLLDIFVMALKYIKNVRVDGLVEGLPSSKRVEVRANSVRL